MPSPLFSLPPRRCVCLSALIALLSSAVGRAESYNFGNVFSHQSVTVQRRLPPVISLANAAVKVEVTAANPQWNSVDAEIQNDIENLLIASDSHVRIDELQAKYLVHASVTSLTEPKVVTVSEGKTSYLRGTADMAVVFQVTDTQTSRRIASGNLQAFIDRDDQATASKMSDVLRSNPFAHKKDDTASPLSPAVMTRDMVKDIATQIASYIVNTSQAVTIPLARGGALDDANKLAVKQLWTRADEQLETLPPFASPGDDAYRLYDIGVADEALAYQAQDAHAAKLLLQKASIAYGKALEDRPKEKYFLDAQNRIDSGIKRYLGDVAAPDNAETHAGKARPEAETAKQSAALTNSDVIQMVQARMDEANILDNIQNEPAVDFDLSVQGQLQLTHGGVSGKVLQAMKQRVRNGSPTKTKASNAGTGH